MSIRETPRAESPPVDLPAQRPIDLLVCITCRYGEADPEGRRDGAALHQALATATLPEGVSLRAVECLSNCARGCSIALRGPGRWTYVYGNLSASDVAVVLDGAARYRAAADGLVPWRERPEHFRRNCIARVPPIEKLHG